MVDVGNGEGSFKFVVATEDDGTEEDHGAITATLRLGSYIIGAESEAVVRVSDDEITATVFLGGARVTSLPEGGRMPLLIVLSKALDGDQTVTLATALGGTATVGVVVNFCHPTLAPLWWPARPLIQHGWTLYHPSLGP